MLPYAKSQYHESWKTIIIKKIFCKKIKDFQAYDSWLNLREVEQQKKDKWILHEKFDYLLIS
jgi:hypothetical protein